MAKKALAPQQSDRTPLGRREVAASSELGRRKACLEEAAGAIESWAKEPQMDFIYLNNFAKAYYGATWGDIRRDKAARKAKRPPYLDAHWAYRDGGAHREGIARVRDAILKAASGVADYMDNGLGPQAAFVIKFAGDFEADVSYMGYVDTRLDVKGGAESRRFAAEFAAKHYDSYISKPSPSKAAHRMSTTVGDVIPVIDTDDFYKAARANIVHACDAHIIRRLILSFSKQGRPIFTVHDCAGVRATDRVFLSTKLQEAYQGLSYSAGGMRFETSTTVSGSFLFF